MTPTFIIAGNLREFEQFTNRKYTELSTSAELFPQYVYVTSGDTLRGHRNPHGFFIGSYKSRPDIREIIYHLATSSESPLSNTIIELWNEVR